jgi:hypothetical protein
MVIDQVMRAVIAESEREVIDNITIAFRTYFHDLELIKTDSGEECLNAIKDGNVYSDIVFKVVTMNHLK